MTCKNCGQDLTTSQAFCPNCGAQVVKERITAKKLWQDMAAKAFGWDNRYLITLKTLLLRPQVLFKEYLDGTRKKYTNPFTFFAIAAAIGLLVFNGFTDDFMSMTTDMNRAQFETMAPFMMKIAKKEHDSKLKKSADGTTEAFDFNAFKERTIKDSMQTQKATLKYYNFIAFLLLPFYTLISFLVYRKPYNFGEHLVMNAYMQGFLLLLTTILFIISLFTSPVIYLSIILFSVLYYLFAYAKLYRLKFGQNVLKFFKFLAVLVGVGLGSSILLFLFGILVGFLRS